MSTIARRSDHESTIAGTPAASNVVEAEWHAGATELIVRGVMPPFPLKAILVALSSMPPGREQFVRTDTRPDDLLRALADHGVATDVTQMPDGSWRSRLVRRSVVQAT